MTPSPHLPKAFRPAFINCHCLSIPFCLFLSITSASQPVKAFQEAFYILLARKPFTPCLPASLRQATSIWRPRALLCHQNSSALLSSLTPFVKPVTDTLQLSQTSYDPLLTPLSLQASGQLWYAGKPVTIEHLLSSRLPTLRSGLQPSQTSGLLRKPFTTRLPNTVKPKPTAVSYIPDSMRLARRPIIAPVTRQNEIHLSSQVLHVYHVDTRTLTIHPSLASVLDLTRQCPHLAYHR